MTDFQDYSLFLKFIETYAPNRFKGIDPEAAVMQDLEQMMAENDQFIYIADAINLQIIFTSKRSLQMMGIEAEDISFYHFMDATHPDDLKRLSNGRSKLVKAAQDLYIAGEGSALLSSNFRLRNAAGGYSNILTQNYLFYRSIPYKTVYSLKIHTNIDWSNKIRHGYHYYNGTDMSYFRYPDKEMLLEGNVFTTREFEIIKLIHTGLSSEEIAHKLCLSLYTINTHRGNILKKTKCTNIPDLIYELKERGIV